MSEAANKVALITGAARRVGAGLARVLAEAGWEVAVHHRGGESLIGRGRDVAFDGIPLP